MRAVFVAALVVGRCAGWRPAGVPSASVVAAAKTAQGERRGRGLFGRLFRRKEASSKADSGRRVLEEEEGSSEALSLSEELQLMTLGYTRVEAQTMGAEEARRRLASRTRPSRRERPTSASVVEDEPSDAELLDLAQREVAATRRFARAELESDDPSALSARELNASLSRSWPDLPGFTKLLTQEALLRLRILGPAFAEPLKEESRMRRNAYKAWLDFVDGVGLFPHDPDAPVLEPEGGRHTEDDDVARVFADLKRRRDELTRLKLQFDDWERRAAKRQLAAPDEKDDKSALVRRRR